MAGEVSLDGSIFSHYARRLGPLGKVEPMARINTPLLVLQATDIGGRANFVRHDPAVVQAAKQARADIDQVRHSTYALLRETRAAWQRSARGPSVEPLARPHPDNIVNFGPA
jgi:hypothetical protein